MNKIYLSFLFFIVVQSSYAQQRLGMQEKPYNKPITVQSNTDRAQGDTLFWFDGDGFVGSIIDTTIFEFRNDDADGLIVAPALDANYGPTSSFEFFAQLAGPNQDTNVYISATSWFSPVAQANNWFTFGPLNIPTGAPSYTLTWQHNIPDGDYRDGYEILASTTGLDFAFDFTSAPLFSVSDNALSTIADTVNFPYVIGSNWGEFEHVWYPRYVDLTQFSGQTIYLAIHHDAYDKFIIHFDNFLITESQLPVSVKEMENTLNNITIAQNQPNPFNNQTTINYSLNNQSNVSFNITDITGREIYTIQNQIQQAGKHNIKLNAENFSEGLYYYSFNCNGKIVTNKMIVTTK
jgi:hypothetical protein